MVDEVMDTAATQESIELHNEAVLALQLASERVALARTTLELREMQLQTVLGAISAEYQENGKFRIAEINIQKRKIERVRIGAV